MFLQVKPYFDPLTSEHAFPAWRVRFPPPPQGLFPKRRDFCFSKVTQEPFPYDF